MIKNILVGLDGSRHADAATRAALTLSGRLRARLDALHVTDLWLLRGSFLHDVGGMLGIEPQIHMADTLESFLKTRSDALLERFRLACADAGATGHTFALTGVVLDEIREAAGQHDLLVLGARGSSFDSGQIAAGRHLPAQLIGNLPVPLLVTSDAAPAFARLGVAFDGSAGAFRALNLAAELSSSLGAPLSVCWVDPGGVEYEGRDALDLARRYLDPFELSPSFERRPGIPRDEVPRWALEAGLDTIVLGSHGGSRLREALLGHLPAQLLEGASAPALIVCP